MKKFVSIARNRTFRVLLSILIFLLLTTSFLYVRYWAIMPQSTIFLLNEVASPQAGQKILVFSPHPDDETIGAGGYIAQARRNGAIVHIILITDGNKHHLVEERYGEFKRATGILGVPEGDLAFWGYPDGKLKDQNQEELKTKIADSINAFSPTVVIYPSLEDLHQDHRTAGTLVDGVLKETEGSITGLQYLVHYRRYPQPKKLEPDFFLLPPVNLVGFDSRWEKVTLSQDIEDDKTRAIYSYKTQLRVPFLRSLILSSLRENELFSLNLSK